MSPPSSQVSPKPKLSANTTARLVEYHRRYLIAAVVTADCAIERQRQAHLRRESTSQLLAFSRQCQRELRHIRRSRCAGPAASPNSIAMLLDRERNFQLTVSLIEDVWLELQRRAVSGLLSTQQLLRLLEHYRLELNETLALAHP